MPSMRMSGFKCSECSAYSDWNPRGVDPLTGDDIAEVIVFAATRPENVVIADTLVFPNHQVSTLFENMVHRALLTQCGQAAAGVLHRRST